MLSNWSIMNSGMEIIPLMSLITGTPTKSASAIVDNSEWNKSEIENIKTKRFGGHRMVLTENRKSHSNFLRNHKSSFILLCIIKNGLRYFYKNRLNFALFDTYCWHNDSFHNGDWIWCPWCYKIITYKIMWQFALWRLFLLFCFAVWWESGIFAPFSSKVTKK